ncbi:nucleotide exchange factor GrpE [Effusibacillus lacus]|uniref:Nucleotide exchange factor GrpE n=1 Tax=Effusibacillus lacus TaxID=1348429 RepID=A0A292YPJ0_9BACL|nr:nucleotide exchange factor GrpE [Effusibacillus lacus]TCS72009.1 GrpE protein [Effusibacillus lacus]GAX90304.1 hypothetical protein EFBL_1930 [Effusibacillus lacus]
MKNKNHRNLISFCEQELAHLEQFVHELEPEDHNNTLQFAKETIGEIAEAIKKGDRANLKMLKEISMKLDELAEKLQVPASKPDHSQTILAMLEMFDLMDFMGSNMQPDDENWTRQFQQVIEKALALLQKIGIQELKIENQMFDSEIMEGIGTVSQNEINRELEKNSVYAVMQRGFRYSDSGELIRRAKVITVV